MLHHVLVLLYFLLPNIPLCGYTTYCPLMSNWVVPAFWLLKNNAAINSHTQCLLGCIFSFLLGIYLEMELLSHMVTLCLTFGRTVNLFSKQLQHFWFSPVKYKGYNFTIAFPIFIIVYLFYYNYPIGYEVLFYCSFEFHFLVTNDVEDILCAYWLSIYFL